LQTLKANAEKNKKSLQSSTQENWFKKFPNASKKYKYTDTLPDKLNKQ
jgi:hypothetical protein